MSRSAILRAMLLALAALGAALGAAAVLPSHAPRPAR